MTRLWYATTNNAKVLSLRDRLEPHGFEVVQRPITIPEPRLDRVEDMAAIKAMLAYGEIQEPVVANDAGFYIYGINGFPRGFVNFALATIKLDGLIKLAAGTNRRCEFRHALAFHDGQVDTPKVFVDTVRGTMAIEPRGTIQPWHWSVLATIFIPDGREQTLAEMSEAEYKTWRDSSRDPTYAQQFLNWYRVNRPNTFPGGQA